MHAENFRYYCGVIVRPLLLYKAKVSKSEGEISLALPERLVVIATMAHKLNLVVLTSLVSLSVQQNCAALL